jgi:multidrug efflux pump subunit AcrB
MTSLPRFSVHNPVLVNLFMMTILVGGVYSAMTLVREMFPESRPNQILITTSYPGATPAEVEKGITLKIEEQIKDIEGVETVRSTITEGLSMILVEMESGFDAMDRAVNDVESAIASIPTEDFPEEALETRVTKFEPRLPVIDVSLFSDLGDRALKQLGERLREDVLALPGITEVMLGGTRKDEISVEVRPDKLVEFGLSFMQVAEAIASSNLDLPGGQVRTPSVNVAVRTLGEKDRGEDLHDIVIHSDPDGRIIRVRDVATVVDGFEDVDTAGSFRGVPAVTLVVYETPGQDAIKIASLVRAMVAGKTGQPLEQPWTDRLLAKLSGKNPVRDAYEKAKGDPYPPGFGIETHSDLSVFISGRLDLLMRNGRWGLLLVFLSLLVFLHWRVALWVMMGLILAITGALVCMKLVGLTLNLITMGGLIIVLGLLVDDAIIVSEHVYSKVEQGVEPRLAAIAGTEEVTWPVVCAIVTTVVAFFPLRFIKGQIGDWMGVLPLVACVALTVSLIEALTILPSHLGHSLRPRTVRGTTSDAPARTALRSRLRLVGGGNLLMGLLRKPYERLLRIATSYRYVTMAALTGCLFVAMGAVRGGHVPFVFLQKMDSDSLFANIKMGVAAPIARTREATNIIEKAALERAEVRNVFALIGSQFNMDGAPSAPQSHLGQVFMELVPSEEREATSEDILQDLRAKTANLPGVDQLRFEAVHGGPGGAAIHLEVRGHRLEDLIEVADELKRRLAGFDGVVDIADDFDAGRPEVQIELNESARALGLTTRSLATQVRSAFYGFEARKIQRGREDVKIMVRFPPEYRRRIYDLESMRVATPSGDLVPFTEVARLTEGTGYASIHRTDQLRTVTVKADVDENVTNSRQVMESLSRSFPEILRDYPGAEVAFGGQQLETAKAFGSLGQAFLIAMLLIFVILAGLFRSYVQPLIVMTVIPFGLIGAVTGHFVMGYPLTIASLLGIVALTGVVVNDSMILVTFINKRVTEGIPLREAVIEGGMGRLRPILLTSATTVLGMGPLLLETSFQAKFLIPMGISLSAGLIFATVLTLLAVPSLYLIVVDVKRVLRGFFTWLIGRPAAQPVGDP